MQLAPKRNEDPKICSKCYFKLRKAEIQDCRDESPVQTVSPVETIAKNFASLTKSEQSLLVEAVGKHLKTLLKSDAEKERNSKKSIENMITKFSESFFASRSEVLQVFVNSLSIEQIEAKTKARAVEAMMQLAHRKFIAPLAFKQLVLISNLTNSKTIIDVVCSNLPSGNRTTLNLLLQENVSIRESRVLPSHYDVIVSTDNQQIIGRDYNVVAYRKPPVTSCSAVLHAFVPASTLQLDPENDLELHLGKGHVLTSNESDLSKAVTLSDSEDLAATTELKRVFATTLDRVKKERKCGFDDYMQELSSVIELVDFARKCLSCKKEVSKSARKCKYCQKDLINNTETAKFLLRSVEELRSKVHPDCLTEIEAPRFNHIPIGERYDMTFVNDDPIFALPNSYLSCIKICRDLGKRLDVKRYGGTRFYVVLACDGKPYTLIRNIIQNHIQCTVCGMGVWSRAKFD